jgi:hypothetical protein
MVQDEGISQKPEHTSQVVDPSCPSEIDQPSRQGSWSGAVGEITLFEKYSGILTKRISLGKDGQPVSDASACRMSKGRARRERFSSPGEFARAIAACTSTQALSLGRLGPDLPNEVNICARNKLPGRAGSTTVVTIARTLDSLVFEGVGALLLDIDLKGMPEGLNLPSVDRDWPKILTAAVPELRGCAMVCRASTSAGLRDTANGRAFQGSGGAHVYVFLSDMSRSKEVLQRISDRLWLVGFGWYWISAGQALLQRSLVDTSVGSPERLVFEGAPLIDLPLEQDAAAREPKVIEGRLLDPSEIPPLTPVERRKVAEAQRAAKEALQPEAERRQKLADASAADALAQKRGISRAAAMEVLLQKRKRDLLPDAELIFTDDRLGVKTVRDVLLDRKAFHRQPMADPIEGPSYGRTTATPLTQRDPPIVKSFAHGGIEYRLLHTAASLHELIKQEQAAGRDVAKAFTEAGAFSNLSDLELNQLIAVVQRHSGMGKLALKRAFNTASTNAARAFNDELEAEHRPTFCVPAITAPNAAVSIEIDALLGEDWGRERPLRDINGRLVRMEARANIPLLQAIDTRFDEVREEVQQTRIANSSIARVHWMRPLDDLGVAHLVEQYVRCVKPNKGGIEVETRLPEVFCQGLNTLAANQSRVPTCKGVQETPIVVNGKLVTADGFEPRTGLFFTSDPDLEAALPMTATLQDARKAFDWLSCDWLADVQTDREGKAVLIALAASCIQRHAAAKIPLTLVTSGQAGSGKTTAVEMISMAAFGSPAPTFGWADIEEERRKMLHAAAVSGAPMIAFDNVKRGGVVQCRALDRFITSAEISDRDLGHSRTVKASAAIPIAFTGNAISVGGDTASRTLIVHIDANRIDPENRPFRHRDILGWTRSKRTEILKRIFTILLVERPIVTPATTLGGRFPEWWCAVGHPIELAFGEEIFEGRLDFGRMMAANRSEDAEAQSLATIFDALADQFGLGKWFGVEEIFNAIGSGGMVSNGNGANQMNRLADAFDALGGSLRNPTDESARRTVGSILRSRNGQIVNAGGQDLTLEATFKRDRNVYRVIARPECF